MVKSRIVPGAIATLTVWMVFFAGCAGPSKARHAKPIPKIKSGELVDSLIAADTMLTRTRILGHGVYKQGNVKRGFRVGIVADRENGKLAAYISAGFVGVVAVLWLCNPDSLCIYLPMQNYAMKEPVGHDIEGVVLPPSAPVMIDMFSAQSPIRRFAGYLKELERTQSGYYLTFDRGDEALIVLAKPNPWHIAGYQWVSQKNPPQVVDVQFKEGQFRDGVWVPQKIKISQPTLDQEIEITIEKYLINPQIPDSLFYPKIPEDVNWYRLFEEK